MGLALDQDTVVVLVRGVLLLLVCEQRAGLSNWSSSSGIHWTLNSKISDVMYKTTFMPFLCGYFFWYWFCPTQDEFLLIFLPVSSRSESYITFGYYIITSKCCTKYWTKWKEKNDRVALTLGCPPSDCPSRTMTRTSIWRHSLALSLCKTFLGLKCSELPFACL